MSAGRVVIIGGGIAGLSAAWRLVRKGAPVTLVEAERFSGVHSSGRNAQIWLPLDHDRTTSEMALGTEQVLNKLLGAEEKWLRRRRAVALFADQRGAEHASAAGNAAGLASRIDSGWRKAYPGIATEGPTVVAERAGIFDPHAMLRALTRAAADEGAELLFHSRAVAVDVGDGRVRGVRLASGETLAADLVVNAAGAEAAQLGHSLGASEPLRPLRRHLAVLDVDPSDFPPIFWSFAQPEFYLRHEAGGLLACPCDEEPCEPGLPVARHSALEFLGRKLEGRAPQLVDAPVRTFWACLRPYTPDRELLLGPDPRVEGLYWFAGFGGRGMTIALGASRWLERSIDAEDDPLLPLMRPGRFGDI